MKIPRKFLVSTCMVLVLLITLLAGLKPKGYRFRNGVSWMRHNVGITIGPIGIAFTKDSLQWSGQNSRDSGFSIEVSIEASKFQSYGIGKIIGFGMALPGTADDWPMEKPPYCPRTGYAYKARIPGIRRRFGP